MNKKGEVNMFGIILVSFMAIIVGVILFQVIAQTVGDSTNTVSVVNESLDTVVNGTLQYLTDYRSISSVVILNETDPSGFTANETLLTSGNYTITNNVIHPTTGDLCVSIEPTASANVKSAWQVSATAQPLTYIADSGGRAMAALIVIFFALAVAVIALEPTLRSGVLDAIGK